MNADRSLPWDWYAGKVPENVTVDPTAYLETSYSFVFFHSKRSNAVEIGRASSIYLGVMFDLGENGGVKIGSYVLMNGARIICDSQISIGNYSLISWNVVLMDTYRLPTEAVRRRTQLERIEEIRAHQDFSNEPARPIRIGSNVWIGFDCCVLPGVTIGDGAVIGARSVVAADVPPFSVAVGNPARIIRQLEPSEIPIHA